MRRGEVVFFRPLDFSYIVSYFERFIKTFFIKFIMCVKSVLIHKATLFKNVTHGRVIIPRRSPKSIKTKRHHKINQRRRNTLAYLIFMVVSPLLYLLVFYHITVILSIGRTYKNFIYLLVILPLDRPGNLWYYITVERKCYPPRRGGEVREFVLKV